jgi:biopolymer transport protein ExbD
VQAANPLGGSAIDELIAQKREPESPEFDITAMIDLVFMMNIYFLVTFLGVASGALALPSANHCSSLDADTAVILTVARANDGESVVVYLGESKESEPITDPRDQEQRITTVVEQGLSSGKTAVLLKAEKNVRLREIKRIVAAASVEGVTLHASVMEKDVAP